MAAKSENGRRSYGTGSLFVKTDSAGRESWYGKWRSNGRQIKRRLGWKRSEGSKDGLTRRQAEAELRKLMAEVAAPRAVGERLTIAELGQRYVRDLERGGRKRTTIIAVNLALRVHLEPFFGERAIDAIDPEDIDDLVALMQSRGLAPKTIRNYIGTLSAMFNFARSQRRPLISANPCNRVKLPPVKERTEIRFLDVDEVEALVANVPDRPYQRLDRAMFLTAAMTGLRQGECIALRWRDVDWAAGRIRVRQNYVRGEYGTPKSKRSTRSVPMADRVAGELDRLFQASARQGDDDLVFTDPHSGGRYTGRDCSTASERPSGPRGWTRSGRSTTCGTPSARAWPRPACRCGRSRSGWATATSRPRRSTPTMRRVPMRQPSSKRRSPRLYAPQYVRCRRI
jgi:integrase